jgi:hypothetical protein
MINQRQDQKNFSGSEEPENFFASGLTASLDPI